MLSSHQSKSSSSKSKASNSKEKAKFGKEKDKKSGKEKNKTKAKTKIQHISLYCAVYTPQFGNYYHWAFATHHEATDE
ncbi:hypothetical protein QBC33DRAFT_536358 [Phialemonium atrogriseum]|uniref:Uncharacterized protein n=1 Tax=Phialemonium atrogriseum TaxID=1093897 RepID=A0AAJ0C3R1_9PEZI|nr:uncharacterized protein QBC33DRAFT_536358 [Phialemonium atrogriseum]KAK1768142.1 hypothetical protein QBC33DRAFT_536358 [Phialemonium atrogriseum]